MSGGDGVGLGILAAGCSRRFGRQKLLEPVAGEPLVVRTVREALQVGAERTVIVVGHQAAAVTRAIRQGTVVEDSQGGRVTIVHNLDYRSGQASSVASAVDAWMQAPELDVGVILLGDQPCIDASSVDRVVQVLRASPSAFCARVRYSDGLAGHPVAFRRSFWPRLAGLTGDVGARELFDRYPPVETAWPSARPQDIDTPADLGCEENAHGPCNG